MDVFNELQIKRQEQHDYDYFSKFKKITFGFQGTKQYLKFSFELADFSFNKIFGMTHYYLPQKRKLYDVSYTEHQC